MLGMGKEGRAWAERMFEGERVTKRAQTGPTKWSAYGNVPVHAPP